MWLAAPAAASATTQAQAEKAVAKKLAHVYGKAWRRHTPSWSKPECRVPGAPGAYTCETEFAYAGVWHLAIATVSGAKVKLLRVPHDHWVRGWKTSGADCARQANFSVPGELSSNDGGCYALTLWQNFGAGSDGVVKYTGFKRSVAIYGTGTALFPDFTTFKCTFRGGIYECKNRFGDGLRWKPDAAAAPQVTEFFARLTAGTIGCAVAGGPLLVCRATPPASQPVTQVATLKPDGTLTACAQQPGASNCLQGDFGENTPTYAPGQQVTLGAFVCSVLDAGVQCTVAAAGKGFLITPQQITPVG